MRRDALRGFGRHVARGAALGAIIAVVATLQYFTPPSRFGLHAIYLRAYYVPIFLGGVWYGMAGGLLTALVSVAACALDVQGAPPGAPPYLISQYAEFAVFLLVGGAVGVVATRERRRAAGYRDALTTVSGDAARELRDLRRADRSSALALIAAGLIHEIERPVTGLKNALDGAADRSVPEGGDQEVTRIARREVRRLELLLNRLIAYTQPCEPRLEETHLAELVEHVSGRLSAQAARKNVSMQFDATPALPPLLADPRHIEQALFNVALNAVQASARGGRVAVRIGAGAHAQVIEVIDDGPGIAREYQHRIFEPFFTTKERGVGLGLAIAQRIVDAHHGTIDVKRRASGGTVVRIELPETAPMRAADGSQLVEARTA